jgi:hypothetical protein
MTNDTLNSFGLLPGDPKKIALYHGHKNKLLF